MSTLPPVLTPLSRLPDFDPRRVPVLGTDAALPPVAAERLRPEALQQRFLNPPSWAPEVTHERRFADRQPAHASVLVPIVLRDDPTVLLTLRTTQLSTHSGQVAFPGGRMDDTDPTPADTALREAEEEVGLARHRVQVLGSLPLYTTGTAFMVTPVVGLVQPGFELQLNPHEVAAAFEVPLSFLMNPANHRRHAFEAEGVRREWFSMPWMDGADERFIWGATAGMLRNFYRFLSA
ncbi:CoA pyrophosphatase [Curvibacter sp. RS43]|uniref:CoA pyrophosphatase n=1 Tax=Curvibacter microcysteis TaxID=3026419 RepID=UPI00235E0B5A|nr:CoA pyrophosphatase [Curvibacter sp. RS43]MDD0810603.1 CoA pyrophosphatase [Curvibacter sp. RS43]